MKLREIINDPPKDYYSRLAQVESNNNPLAKAKTSSASGLYQFTEGTWNQLTDELGLNYTLDDRFDAKKSRKVVEEFTRRNERSLENRLGRKPNEAELYLAHFSGAEGAGKLLDTIGKDPNTPVTDFVSQGALKANKSIFFNKDGSAKKAYEIYNWSAKKFNSPDIEAPSTTDSALSKIPEKSQQQRQVAIDNTAVKTNKYNPPIIPKGNPNYAELPELEQVEKVEEKPNGISEEQLRNLLAKEREATEKRFMQAFQQQSTPEQPEYAPQPAQEDLSYLYNYIDIDTFAEGGKYKVKSGDNLSKIAKANNIPLDFLIKNNNIKNPDNISVGEELNITGVNPNEDIILKNIIQPKKQVFGPTITEEQAQTINLDEVEVVASKKAFERKKKLEGLDRLDTNYYKYTDGIDTDKISGKENTLEVQKFLSKEGYNLNPDGKFKNEGIDGKLGTVTKQAIKDYNDRETDSTPYTPIKQGEGFLGNCNEKQCSEYVQNEIFRNLDSEQDRADWNNNLGITGDAWDIGKNIVDKGGKEVPNSTRKPGDVVTIYTGGHSNYQDQADKAGTGTTHTALVDKVNPDGSYYILHNVHEKKGDDYVGREYRDLVKGDRVQGVRAWAQIKNTFRPNYSNKTPDKVKVKENIDIQSDVDISDEFITPLKDKEFKNEFVNRENLDEDEFYSISKAALGIMGQETKFGEDITYKYGLKRIGAEGSKLVGAKNNEVSLGPGSMKLDTNFNSADIGLYNVNKDNITKPDNAVKATMLKLSRDYKRMLSKGFDKKDALYRAIQIYNGGLNTVTAGKKREDWAKDYDLDYVNKVINFGSRFSVSQKDKEFLTTFDELTVIDKVASWDDYVRQELD